MAIDKSNIFVIEIVVNMLGIEGFICI